MEQVEEYIQNHVNDIADKRAAGLYQSFPKIPLAELGTFQAVMAEIEKRSNCTIECLVVGDTMATYKISY